MLTEKLNKLQHSSTEIRDFNVRIGDTGIAPQDSANLGPRRLVKQRFQRMRRRHQRMNSSASAPTGWVARMA